MDMDNQLFIDTLKRIGYPGVNSIDPRSAEFTHEIESNLSFLQWMFNSISEENVLTAAELEEYQQLQDSGGTLSGSHLEEALKVMTWNNAPLSNGGDDIHQLEESLKQTKILKETMKYRSDKLKVQHLTLCNKVTQMEEVEEQCKTCKKMTENISSHDTKVDQALEKLLESVESLVHLYKGSTAKSGAGDSVEGHPVFLSQIDLNAFHEAEERFSHDLTAFTKKQFFEGMAELSGDKEKLQYDLLDVTSAVHTQVGDKDQVSFIEDCQEFSRLQRIFPKSECDHINALLSAKKALSAVHEARSILHQLKSGQFPTSPSEISRLHHSAEESIEAAKEVASPLASSLPDLLRELGGLQGTEILTGDYSLKLKRQDYFTRKQEKVIEQLLSQRARNEFLTMMYDLETRCHRETHALLTSVKQMLEKHLQEWQQRKQGLEDPDLSASKFERSVVDTRDTSSSKLYSLLGNSEKDEKMMYLPKEKLVAKAKDFHDNYIRAEALDHTMDEKYLNKVSELEQSLKKCEATLYAGSTTSGGQPNLSPPQVQTAMATLTSKCAGLQTDITEIIKDIETKKMKLKNSFLRKEKELFTLFHLQPTKLRDLLNSLTVSTQDRL
ncbi:unnamed protein product [Lymnaea stagnalis]|uniref:HAUS augmin-like complex subunit 3 N-terminal domain-containing protein n=1 Tax=Lymnaea stagnalis TaxID=6523 RepID=A0AAV2H771_LYMST